MITALPSRMQAKIVTAGDCWDWTGALTSRGYGSFSHEGRIWSTHRLAYELLVGPIPADLTVDHLCRNKRCANPAHMEIVTRAENTMRAARRPIRCPHGHPLVEPNLLIKPRPNGRTIRNCRVCALDDSRRRRAASRVYKAADRKRAEILLAAERTLLNFLEAA